MWTSRKATWIAGPLLGVAGLLVALGGCTEKHPQPEPKVDPHHVSAGPKASLTYYYIPG